MKIEIFGIRPETTCWHVLVDGGAVGRIQRHLGNGSWASKWESEVRERYTPAQQAEIHAVVKEKLLVLTLTDRLLK